MNKKQLCILQKKVSSFYEKNIGYDWIDINHSFTTENGWSINVFHDEWFFMDEDSFLDWYAHADNKKRGFYLEQVVEKLTMECAIVDYIDSFKALPLTGFQVAGFAGGGEISHIEILANKKISFFLKDLWA